MGLPMLRDGPDRAMALARYRAMAAGYDATCARIEAIRSAAVDALQLSPGDTVFDVACGTGPQLVQLARRVSPGGRVLGIEQSPEMADIAHARVNRVGSSVSVSVLVAPVEDARPECVADALLLSYTHDVLQNPAAVLTLLRHARPGARVVLAGMRFLPWWWAAPLNLIVGYRARHYLSTYRGLRQPWAPLLPHCPDLKVVRTFHAGTSYLAVGTIGAAASC